MIEVVSFDVGGTIATTDRPSFTSYLGNQSHLLRDVYLERARSQLLTIDHFDDVAIRALCGELGIDRAAWPDVWSPAPLAPLPGAQGVVDAIAESRRVVTLSNVCKRDAIDGEIEQLFPSVSMVFRSCDIGATKPDPKAFLAVAVELGVEPSRILHIGDSWRCDVEGAHRVGAQAAYVGPTREGVISGLSIEHLFDKLLMRGLLS